MIVNGVARQLDHGEAWEGFQVRLATVVIITIPCDCSSGRVESPQEPPGGYNQPRSIPNTYVEGIPMPIHDWTRVGAGIFHDFHHAWIEELKRSLNRGVLPPDYYALAEQFAAGFGPDVLTLQGNGNGTPLAPGDVGPEAGGRGGVLLAARNSNSPARRKWTTTAARKSTSPSAMPAGTTSSPSLKWCRRATSQH